MPRRRHTVIPILVVLVLAGAAVPALSLVARVTSSAIAQGSKPALRAPSVPTGSHGGAEHTAAAPAGPVPVRWPRHVMLGLANGPIEWMTGSGAKWDARYQYLSAGVNTGHGWSTWNSPPGAFALGYMRESGANGYLPVFSYYQMLQSNPATGSSEGDKDYSNLNNATTMNAYFADFKLLLDQARTYGKPVVVQVEPDLWGYLEQKAGSCGKASCVSAAVASSGYAAVAGYPNTVQGFAEALLHLRDTYAPNVIMAIHASCWGSGMDVCGRPTTTADTTTRGRRDGAFLASAGIRGNSRKTSTWDLIFTDTSDRDAGYYQYVYHNPHAWWDRTNRTLPSFANFQAWLAAVNAAAGRRIVLWQIPLGNQYFRTDNNTDGHYQDNRAEYFLGDGPSYRHLRDFAHAGVVGLLFGAGAAGPTTYIDGKHDGITNPAPVVSYQCNACNTHVSRYSDDDGGYLRIFGGAYLRRGGIPIPGARGVPSHATTAAMPLISRDVPAYASSAYSPASYANDGSYDTAWRSYGAHAWLAYDLSRVPVARRRTVLVAWYNGSYEYDNAVIGAPFYNVPKDYTLAVNAAPGGGAPPLSGWVTLLQIRGNTAHSRQHVLTMSGYNWVRLATTAVDGTTYNDDVSVNMDVYDAPPGTADDWIFYGDSITAGGMDHNTIDGVPSFTQLVMAAVRDHFPAAEDGGIPYLTSADGAAHVPAWLTRFPGKYVGLSYGTNDASGCLSPASFYHNYVTMVRAVLKAGKVPVAPHIPWARSAAVQRCGPPLNAALDRLYAAFPQVVRGPDLWTFFARHRNLISNDNLHPTDTGYAALRRQWAAAVAAEIYRTSAQPPAP